MGNYEIDEEKLKEMFKNGTISFNFVDDVNQMLKEWIEDAKILGEKYKVKEYKQLKKELESNK